jgi:hypothetical protein
MENSFGSIPSTSSSEDGKPPGIHIKEELGKEQPSPDNLKLVRSIMLWKTVLSNDYGFLGYAIKNDKK